MRPVAIDPRDLETLQPLLARLGCAIEAIHARLELAALGRAPIAVPDLARLQACVGALHALGGTLCSRSPVAVEFPARGGGATGPQQGKGQSTYEPGPQDVSVSLHT